MLEWQNLLCLERAFPFMNYFAPNAPLRECWRWLQVGQSKTWCRGPLLLSEKFHELDFSGQAGYGLAMLRELSRRVSRHEPPEAAIVRKGLKPGPGETKICTKNDQYRINPQRYEY